MEKLSELLNLCNILLIIGLAFVAVATFKSSQLGTQDQIGRIASGIIGIIIILISVICITKSEKNHAILSKVCNNSTSIILLSCNNNDQDRLDKIEEVLSQTSCIHVHKKTTPPTEQAIKNNPTSTVRFFKKDDYEKASQLAKYLSMRTGIKIGLANLSRYYENNKEVDNTFEIWLNDDPK